MIPNDPLALPVCGRNRNLNRQNWLELSEYYGLPQRAAERIIDEQIAALEPSLELISNSFLPEEMKDEFKVILQDTTATLNA